MASDVSAQQCRACDGAGTAAPWRGLQVIGAGCGRTGTASLKKALEMLGFDPCYHMFEVIKHNHSSRWEAAFRDGSGFGSLVQGYRSQVDFPAAVAYTELMEAFPEAKVVLSVREPMSWARSVRETIWSPYSLELSWVLTPFNRSFQRMAKLFRARFFGDEDGGVRSGAIYNDKALVAAFEAWNARVVATVPPERLLVFSATDGWGPLCAFLGVPEPSEPYPRVNDSEEFKARQRVLWRKAAALEAALVVGIGAALVAALRRR